MALTCVLSYKTLRKGNQAYSEGNSVFPNSDLEARKKVVEGQNPFAVILCCSDSRVVPELIFDTGIGDLFVIRVAGNIIDDAIIASIEYAVSKLHSSLVVVLGHESCGAVTAAVNDVNEGHLGVLVEKIKPAVEKAKQMEGELINNAIKQNAILIAELLSNSDPILKPKYDDKTLKILPAYYSLETGKVDFLKE